MIEVLIFHLHIVGALYAFTQRWQEDGAKEGFLAVGLMALIFMIGWAITGGIAQLITPKGGFTTWFNTGTVSLVLLILPEIFIFRMLFLAKKEKFAQEKADEAA
jgi:uncharacterized membrane protein YhdT